MAQRVLYPCYFDEKLTRKEGRRVARGLAVGNPTASAVMRAARALGLKPILETKPHPARWFTGEGRIAVEFDGSKEELLKKSRKTSDPPRTKPFLFYTPFRNPAPLRKFRIEAFFLFKTGFPD